MPGPGPVIGSDSDSNVDARVGDANLIVLGTSYIHSPLCLIDG